MNVEDVAVRVESVFAEVFGDRLPFKRELTRTDNDYWTSLKHMEFLVALEVEFGIRFDGGDAVDMQSVNTVIERIAERVQ
ncbi:MAG TPA: acyl carrier protein [Gammaproteobacteria bacterium]|nr:acyl carrier protein [Gammaproteobacteria bacterium]